MTKMEIRSSVELREAGEMKLVGYPIVFNSLSEDLGGYRERLAPGCLDRTLKERPDIFALAYHNRNMVLGRTSADTLRITQDEKGALSEIILPDTTLGRDTWVSVKRGDLRSMSFGFRINKDSWEKIDGIYVNTLLDIELIEVSVVAMPAYRETSVQARHLTSPSLYEKELLIAKMKSRPWSS